MIPMITFDQFQQVDIRIGTVVKAEVPSWSHWVMRLTVDLGEEISEKVCFSGIMKFFRPESFVGKQFPFVVNLEPKKIGPDKEFSEAMMIMACPGGDDMEQKSSSHVIILPYGSDERNNKNGQSQERQKGNKT